MFGAAWGPRTGVPRRRPQRAGQRVPLRFGPARGAPARPRATVRGIDARAGLRPPAPDRDRFFNHHAADQRWNFPSAGAPRLTRRSNHAKSTESSLVEQVVGSFYFARGPRAGGAGGAG